MDGKTNQKVLMSIRSLGIDISIRKCLQSLLHGFPYALVKTRDSKNFILKLFISGKVFYPNIHHNGSKLVKILPLFCIQVNDAWLFVCCWIIIIYKMSELFINVNHIFGKKTLHAKQEITFFHNGTRTFVYTRHIIYEFIFRTDSIEQHIRFVHRF